MKMLAYVTIFILLIISAVYITYMKGLTIRTQNKYPPTRSCDFYH